MGLEVATYIHELDPSNPIGGSDPKSQGDDHIRLTKSTLQNTLPNVTGPITLSHTQINNAAIKTEANVFTARQSFLRASAEQIAINGPGGAANSYLSLYNTAGVSIGKLQGVEVSAPAGLYLISDIAGGVLNLQTNNGAVTINGGALDLRQLAAGVYSPAVTAGANCSGPTALSHFHQRIGDIVSFSGRISVTVTSGGGVLTSVAIAVPVPSNFSSSHHVAGTGVGSTSNPANAYVYADTINDRLIVEFFSTTSGLQDIIYSGQYRIL